MPLRILALVLLALGVVGCTTAQLDSWNKPLPEPPCDAQSPYRCQDGHSCCKSYAPVCWGPDDEGYYCQPHDFNPDDPGNVLFGAKQHRERAVPRVDE